MFSCVLLLHRLEFFPPETSFLKAALTTTPPLSHPLPSTLLAGTTLVRIYHRPHISQYNPRARATEFLFRFLTLEDATYTFSRNVGKKLPLPTS
jgi:hypothetical protein